MSDKIEQAKLLATFVHFGQKRQDGEDYINHPARMIQEYIKSLFGHKYEIDHIVYSWLTIEQINIICAIWLHDTIEDSDSPYHIECLIEDTFEKEIYNIVSVLTHYSKRDSYNEYITKVFQHPIAWQIKWLDMIDNTSYPIPEKQKTKYRDACIHLIAHGIIVPDILKERLNV